MFRCPHEFFAMSLFSIARLTSNCVRRFCGRNLDEHWARPIPKASRFHPFSGCVLDDFWTISGRNIMSGISESAPDENQFGGLADGYPSKMPRKFRLLLPLKSHIEGLLAKRASYDDIRILLEKANIVVSKNTVYRFCRDVIGQRPARQPIPPKNQAAKVPSVLPFPVDMSVPNARSIEATLQEQRSQRDRLPGLWGRRKRGPRIADSKNL